MKLRVHARHATSFRSVTVVTPIAHTCDSDAKFQMLDHLVVLLLHFIYLFLVHGILPTHHKTTFVTCIAAVYIAEKIDLGIQVLERQVEVTFKILDPLRTEKRVGRTQCGLPKFAPQMNPLTATPAYDWPR